MLIDCTCKEHNFYDLCFVYLYTISTKDLYIFLMYTSYSVLGKSSRNIQRCMKLGTWNVRSLYRAQSLKSAARELGRYKLDVVGV